MAGFMDISGTNLIIKSSNTKENILCASDYTTILTKCQANNGITVKKSIVYSSNMIGYTYTFSNDVNLTLPANTSTIYSLRNTAVSIPRGVYIININIGLIAATSGTYLNLITSGLSTSNSSYVSGTGVCATLNKSVLTTAVNQNVFGIDCRPVDLSGNSYFLLINGNVSNSVQANTSSCTVSCTRIA